jgi:hypothetical protein
MSNSIDGWIMGMFFFIDFLLWNVIYSWQVYNLWKPMEVNHCMDSNIGTNSKWTSHLGLLTHPRWTNTHNCTKSLFWIRHFKGHIKPRKHYYCKVSINNHECTQWMIWTFMLWLAQGNEIVFVFYIKSCHGELTMEWRGWHGCLNWPWFFKTCAIYFMLIQATTFKSRCLHAANVFNWCIVIVSKKLSFYMRSRSNSNGHRCGRNAWQLNINVCLVKGLLSIWI